MDIRLFFFEDDDFEHFSPLTYNRPVYQLLSGALPVWKKWQYYFPQADIKFLCRNEIAAYTREQTGIACNRFEFENCDKAIFINGRVLPDEQLIKAINSLEDEALFLTNGNLSVAAINPISKTASELAQMNYWGYGHFKAILKDLPKKDIDCKWLNYIWDFIAQNPDQIEADWNLISKNSTKSISSPDKLFQQGSWVYRPEKIMIANSAKIDAQVVLDARTGPIIIAENVYIAPHSRIEGPSYIGPDTQIVGGKIREGCSFGPMCRAGGEIEESIFLGYSNKYHDGFIGHAYLGEWVNLGAMTTNSDLKNNYGTIRVDNGSGQMDTGLIKVGSFIGDHVKSGIGMLFNTGISIGFGANIFGGGLIVDKLIPPFIWGGNNKYFEYQHEKAMQTAEIVMTRRGVEMTSKCKKLFNDIFDSTSEVRNNFITKKGSGLQA